jgi:glycosyltransferase involved in cell wall biosynthesis
MEQSFSRERIGIDFKGRIILAVGNLIKSKGFQYLIEAAAPILKDPENNVRIYIVGGSGGALSYHSALQKLARELEVEDRVVFWGPADHEKMAFLYNSADLFCHFSESEGCPNVLVEATACGLPSVVCGEWADKEIIPSENVGFIVPSRKKADLETAIRKALSSEWSREKIRSHSLQNSWNRVADRTLELYREMLD